MYGVWILGLQDQGFLKNKKEKFSFSKAAMWEKQSIESKKGCWKLDLYSGEGVHEKVEIQLSNIHNSCEELGKRKMNFVASSWL